MDCNNNNNNNKLIILIMGVSGSGKTTTAIKLADQLNCGFNDADEFHSEANINKMKSGIPLNDDDRKPWLNTINNRMIQFLNNNDGKRNYHVFTCSALKSIYREMISKSIPKNNLLIVYLKGDKDILSERIQSRQGHFFNPSLLDNQLQVLEEPNENDLTNNNFLIINIKQSPQDIINIILNYINSSQIQN